ncbi:TonB-dependent receptor domain-containing protein [Novosphingobium terrae]|uniref:TonB-dependent receptor domain-containing protein n=1 Tax=Novosphingobium terrae TaxID=2726189 RepID=UPI001982290E|nr:TonB-dependent receptor [Novosphingobium terrae]
MDNRMYRSSLRASAGLLAFVVLGGTAHAQDAAAPAKDPAPDHEIIVTGSRLATNGNSSPTPVTVAGVDTLLNAQPAGVIEGLNSLPGLMGSTNPTSNAKSGGVNELNLRGIGYTRGLILIDGRRVGPTQGDGSVDVDVVPQVLLKHVDVVTGGASAAYGSDAVSGVVNFVTDTKFNGLKLDLHSGISNYGDDRKIGVSAAWGTKFSDGRGHFEIGYEYADNAGFLRSSRPFMNNYSSLVGSGTAASPYTTIYGGRLNTVAFGGLINSGPLAGLQFAQNGVLSAFNKGTVTATPSVSTGGDGAYFIGSTAGTPLVNHRSMARLDYDVTDSISAHVTGIFSKFKQSYTQQNPLFSAISIGYNNAYLASVQPQYQATIAAQPVGSSFTFSKMDLSLPAYQYNVLNSYYNVDAGLIGKLGGFDWEADYYRSENHQTTRNNNNINLQHLWAATNAVSSGGQTVCNAALTNPNYANCVPLNLFGPSSDQTTAMSYIEQATSSTQHYTTDDFNGNIKGTLFHLPAGDVKAVVMGEWRKLTYEVGSNATPTDMMDCNGIQFNCVNSQNSLRYLGGQVAIRTPVSQTVTEVAAEAEVPVLADKPFFKSLNLNGAVRYAHYDTSGGAWTWKGGVVWNVSDELTLRATRSRDIRAPNLTDLFAPAALTTVNYNDLHTNTSGIATQLSSGNPTLKPEKADTLTLGFVFKPHWVPGFSLAVDYYKININQALVNLSGFQPATQAACETSGGTAAVCALYVRQHPFSDNTSDNYPTLLLAQTLNVASLATHGIDIEANYAHPIANQLLTARALVTYQPVLRYNNGPTGIVDMGGAADGVAGLPPIPKWKVVGAVSYDITHAVHAMVQERWRAKLKQNGTPSLVFATGNVASVGYTDVNLSVDVARNFTAYFNIQNLFNTAPPLFNSSGASTQLNYFGGFAQGDDTEGRYFTVGVRWRM